YERDAGHQEIGRRRGEGTFRQRASASALLRDRTHDPTVDRGPRAGADRSAGESHCGGDPKCDRGISRIGHMNLSQVVEALLFAAQKALTARELVSAIKGAGDEQDLPPNEFSRTTESQVAAALEQLKI